MRILITGNIGYVGPVLTRFLRENISDAELFGFDAGFFGHSLTGVEALPEILLDQQVFGDIRELPPKLLDGTDAVVHLSAVSNDPMGNKFEAVTGDINQQASVRLAKLAAERGVRNFVFASSCSMYGYAEGGARKESDPTNPLTAYARSKIGAEKAFAELDLGKMTITSLRFASACGMSDRLRLDLVLNDFVACAIASGEITVLSDGTPWRPLIDVEDMARAISWAIVRRPENGGKSSRSTPAATRATIRCADSPRPSPARFRARRFQSTRTLRQTSAPTRSTFRSSSRWRQTPFRRSPSTSRSDACAKG
jgi:nucleoside-diphosphate-sugar epimerase